MFIRIRKYVSECPTPIRMYRAELFHITERNRVHKYFKNTY
jgi:hypothetical protein